MKDRKKSRELGAARHQYFESHGIPEKPWLKKLEPFYKAATDDWPKGADGRLSLMPRRTWNDLMRSDLASLDELISAVANDLPIFVKEIDLIRLMRPSEIAFLKKVLEEYQREGVST